MEFENLELDARIFTQPDAESITIADAHTLNNWVRYGHVAPDRTGGRRMFSAADLIQIDLMVLMQDQYRIKPDESKLVATSDINDYRELFRTDLEEIASGVDWRQLPISAADSTWSLARAGDGALRASSADDPPELEVRIVLPTRLVARSVLAKIKLWMDGRE